MKRKSSEILDLDVQKLIETLNCAISEEWLSFYQYWVGAQIMRGPMRNDIEKELLRHAQQEHGHAQLVLDRVIQLGGTPVLSPDQWMKMSSCQYEIPTDVFIANILKQNLIGERCAIKRYDGLARFTDGIDYATCDMATRILEDELDHENDILDFLEDIKLSFDFMNSKH